MDESQDELAAAVGTASGAGRAIPVSWAGRDGCIADAKLDGDCEARMVSREGRRVGTSAPGGTAKATAGVARGARSPPLAARLVDTAAARVVASASAGLPPTTLVCGLRSVGGCGTRSIPACWS